MAHIQQVNSCHIRQAKEMSLTDFGIGSGKVEIMIIDCGKSYGGGVILTRYVTQSSSSPQHNHGCCSV